MKVGLTLPQGCDREYLGMDAESAWRRTIEIASLADQAGFDSLWLYDHFQVDPPPEEAIVFDPLVELSAIAMCTERAMLGHLVLAAAYRNPALTAKALSTLDVVSGGRAILGIGAGWKEDEWIAYGYGFPDARGRLEILEDSLEVITRMLGPGRATFHGKHAHVIDAIHEPKSLVGGPLPILVGGNGPNRTWRIAARFADELNLDALSPAEVEASLPVIAERCAEVGRDPGSLAVSVHLWGASAVAPPGPARRELFQQYDAIGVSRLMVQGFVGVADGKALELLIDDCAEAGLLDNTS
ncbi:MAG TPA: LLM class flavin-dependent oxidoreductase [Acidimicrobiia bacterium]|nr:LLM class flavin-dependent oxidoreductase [Acidimicrobiia bacterium]